MPEQAITIYREEPSGSLYFDLDLRTADPVVVVDPCERRFWFEDGLVVLDGVKGGGISPEGLILAARDGWWGLRVVSDRLTVKPVHRPGKKKKDQPC